MPRLSYGCPKSTLSGKTIPRTAGAQCGTPITARARRIAANIAKLPDGHAAKYFSNNLRPLKLRPLNL
jgi:hypothetical protein